MKIDLDNWYRILAPRPVVLITTMDEKGNINAAPFSFCMPVSCEPSLVAFGSSPKRHTLANIRKTKEFVLNLPQEGMTQQILICSKDYPLSVNELKEANLTEIKSSKVKPPRVKECFGYLECVFNCEYTLGDHVLVIGKVVEAEIKDGMFKNGGMDLSGVKPLMHVGGSIFSVPYLENPISSTNREDS